MLTFLFHSLGRDDQIFPEVLSRVCPHLSIFFFLKKYSLMVMEVPVKQKKDTYKSYSLEALHCLESCYTHGNIAEKKQTKSALVCFLTRAQNFLCQANHSQKIPFLLQCRTDIFISAVEIEGMTGIGLLLMK